MTVYHESRLSVFRYSEWTDQKTGGPAKGFPKQRGNAATTTLDQHAAYIRRDKVLRRHTEHARAMLAEYGRKSPEYEKAKAAGIIPSFGGYFAKARSLQKLTAHSGLVLLDLDNLATYEDAVTERDRLAEHPAVALCYITKSGAGVHAIVAVSPIPEGYQDHYAAWDSAFKALGVSVDLNDPACKDVSRLAFPAYDPKARYRGEVTPITWERPRTGQDSKSGHGRGGTSGGDTSEGDTLMPLAPPLDHDTLAPYFEIYPRLKAAFDHDATHFPNQRDFTDSGWDGTLSAQGVGNGLDDDVIIGLLRSHNQGRSGDKDAGYYKRTLRSAHEYIAGEKSKELAALAPTPGPEHADLGASPMLDKKSRARLFREDPKLKDAIEHKLGGQGGNTFEDHDRRIAERTFNAGATPEDVVGILKYHYDQHEDSPDRQDSYHRDLVLSVQKSLPVPTSKITNPESSVNDILGVPGFHMVRVMTPGDSSPPEFRFVVDGRAHHAGAPSFLLNQNAFAASVLAIYAKLPNAFKPKDWRLAVARLVEQSEDVGPGHELYPSSHDEMDEMADTLDGYLNLGLEELRDWRAEDVDVIRIAFSNDFTRNPEMQKPFYWGDEKHIFLLGFQRWLQINREYKIGLTQLAASLRQAGWKPVRLEKQKVKFPRAWRKMRKLEKA